MIRRLLAVTLLAAALIDPNVHATSRLRQTPGSSDHVAWVAEALKRMQTIQPGMTREDLLKVFTTEGGQSTGLQRTFVSQDCLYFKVDVQFDAVGRPDMERPVKSAGSSNNFESSIEGGRGGYRDG